MAEREAIVTETIQELIDLKPSYRGRKSFVKVRQLLESAQVSSQLAEQVAFEMVFIRMLDTYDAKTRATYLARELGIRPEESQFGILSEEPDCLEAEAAFLTRNFALLVDRGETNPVNPESWLEDLQARAIPHGITVEVPEETYSAPTPVIIDLL